MALPACRKCGHDLVADAPRCTQCGVKDPSRSDAARAEFKSQAAAGLLFLVIAALAVFLVMLLP
jgi:uncharacterized membrane protein YvbJ